MKYLTAVSFALAMVAAETFDYVIVGAGTAGLVIANRISADPSVTVRVIDPGDDQRLNPNVSIPDNLGNPPGTDLDWKYKTVPQIHSNDRILDAPQGKAWGGSSAINGMSIS
jgi:choline dehydrogenase-like flavoprotein